MFVLRGKSKIDDNKIKQYYAVELRTTRQTAALLGCSPSLVSQHLVKMGIPRRSKRDYPCSDETRQKLARAASANHVCPDELKQRLSKLHTGNRYARGTKRTDEVKRRMSETHRGERNANWKGGLKRQRYCFRFNDSLREDIREQYGRKCFLCGITENGKRLSVHHINFDKQA